MNTRGLPTRPPARLRAWTLGALILAFLAGSLGSSTEARTAAPEIVRHAADATIVKGHWRRQSASDAAGGALLGSDDRGFARTDAPLASPEHYFEITVDAPAQVAYRVWLRLRATGNTKWNDSVWVQFSDAVAADGSALYRIGSTTGLLVNLEACAGCGVSSWGWQDTAYWTSQPSIVRFAAAGTHTLRVQTREDGVAIDQIVLSPADFLQGAPGLAANDRTILAKAPVASASTPYHGTPARVPGTIEARDFDEGGHGIAYHDTSAGNTGGAYRAGDVDLQDDLEGGHNVGWISPGEWLKYTVDVASAGGYTARLRVASPNTSARLRLSFSAGNVAADVTIPRTGAWQKWTDVDVPVTLQAGRQVMTLATDTGGFNITNLTLSTTGGLGSTPGGSPGGPAPYGGTPAPVPGTIQAERFDEGGAGVAYGDETSGNSGGKFRQTDVDIESSSEGGYNIGWTSAGEWLNYTVSVASAGSYTVRLRVASKAGASMHVGFNAASNVWQSVAIPATGGWQAWRTVDVPVTLGAGLQQMTLRFDTGGVNLHHVAVQQGSVSTPGPTPTPPPPPSSGGAGFRMLTWNIKHGQRKSGQYDPRGQAQFIAAQNPDVVVLQEVQTWDENQPETYRRLMEEFTGDTWHLQWAPVNSKAGTEGNILLTRLPVSSSTYHQMHATSDWEALYVNRSVAQATVSVGGVPVHLFGTHLDYHDKSARTKQLDQLMAWARGFDGPRIVGGDFNSWWGEYWVKTMMQEYSDSWEDYTGSNQNGYTVNNAVRFDYLFRSRGHTARVALVKCWVPSTTLSDHNPVVADYVIK